jgi:hypothetical protein
MGLASVGVGLGAATVDGCGSGFGDGSGCFGANTAVAGVKDQVIRPVGQRQTT